VIDIQAVRRLAEAGQRQLSFDARGAVVELDEVPSGSATLYARPLTDAVKVVAGGLVHESLDRDSLWAVEGFTLRDHVLMAIEVDAVTPEQLVEIVTGLGFEWEVINRDTGVL
jgi:hypothetical protein